MKNKKLADGLKKIKKLQEKGTVFSANNFETLEKTELRKAGFLKQIIKGWYYLSSPTDIDGDTTPWYACYYEFLQKYLEQRFRKGYCLSAEASLALHMKQTVVPTQISVILKKGVVNQISLPFNTSLFLYEDKKNFPKELDNVNGINVFSKEVSLVKVGPKYWEENPLEIQIFLSNIDQAKIMDILTEGTGMPSAAGRIVGGLIHMNKERDAKRIKELYEKTFGLSLSVENPFSKGTKVLLDKKAEKSIVGARIKAMWSNFREPVIKIAEGIKKEECSIEDLSIMMEKVKKEDMYHSLSIEGYKITDELIEKVINGNWNIDENEEDLKERNAMAAKGYHDAFELIKEEILDAIEKDENPGELIKDAHQDWFRTLFGPSLQAGILTASQLAGYRTGQVYIKGSMHTPLKKEDLLDAMEVYLDLLVEEENSFVKAVLGHHLFGFIHPYMDGNGRMARFIMNCFLVSGGYKWCVITVDTRDEYMKALEKASVYGEIEEFAIFVKNSMN